MRDDREGQVKQEKDPELKRPDDAIKDLEPEERESEDIKGGFKPIKY